MGGPQRMNTDGILDGRWAVCRDSSGYCIIVDVERYGSKVELTICRGPMVFLEVIADEHNKRLFS